MYKASCLNAYADYLAMVAWQKKEDKRSGFEITHEFGIKCSTEGEECKSRHRFYGLMQMIELGIIVVRNIPGKAASSDPYIGYKIRINKTDVGTLISDQKKEKQW